MKDFKNEIAGALQFISENPSEFHIENDAQIPKMVVSLFYKLQADIVDDEYKLSATARFANELINYIANDTDDFVSELSNTLITKNHDYGDSFFKVAKIMGVFDSFSIRLLDKGFRLENLTSGVANKVTDESIDGTKIDLAGYLILMLVAYDKIELEGNF